MDLYVRIKTLIAAIRPVRRQIRGMAFLLLCLIVLLIIMAVPAFAHPPDIVRITDYASSGRRVSVRGQVAYTGGQDGAYFVTWNFGDGSSPVIVVNGEQDAQGYTPWQSHTYPRRNGAWWYTLRLWGYDHHETYEGRSDSLNVVVTCVFGLCSSYVMPPGCTLCPAPLETDIPSFGGSFLYQEEPMPTRSLEWESAIKGVVEGISPAGPLVAGSTGAGKVNDRPQAVEEFTDTGKLNSEASAALETGAEVEAGKETEVPVDMPGEPLSFEVEPASLRADELQPSGLSGSDR